MNINADFSGIDLTIELVDDTGMLLLIGNQIIPEFSVLLEYAGISRI